jgi:protein FAM50
MDVKRVGDSGIHTSEGSVAGRRAATLAAQSDKARQEYEAVKASIQAQNAAGLGKIDERFSVAVLATEVLEEGLITAQDAKRSSEDKLRRAQELAKEKQEVARKAEEDKKKERADKRKKISSSLSFDPDGDEDCGQEAAAEPVLKKKVSKDPAATTSFLPDRERDALIESQKDKLREEWLLEQERIKNEMLQVTYSYWDGTGHRREVRIRKGTTIGRFLEIVRQELGKEFKNVLTRSSDTLMYVKEDIILPHHVSFYDLIVTKARGKSGPLFHFDVHDDIRLLADARVEKDESHPGKVIPRSWYEKNKHQFPQSRWEVYDPAIERAKYTVHGK